MHPHGVQVFDGADNNAVSRTICHDFHFKLLPTQQRLLDEHLAVQAGIQTAAHNICKLLRRVSNAAARAAQSEAGSYNKRPAPNDPGHGFCLRQSMGRSGAGQVQPEPVHRFLEKLPVFRAAYGRSRSPDELHVIAFQYAAFFQLHGQIERRLPAKCRQKSIRPLSPYDFMYNTGGQRLDVCSVCHVRVSHDGSRIGINQHNLIAFLPQRLTCLSAGVIELTPLADDDGAGTYE